MENYKELAKEIKNHCNKTMVYMFVHPLENTGDSLYWIRILVPPFGSTTSAILASQRLHENAMVNIPKRYENRCCVILMSFARYLVPL